MGRTCRSERQVLPNSMPLHHFVIIKRSNRGDVIDMCTPIILNITGIFHSVQNYQHFGPWMVAVTTQPHFSNNSNQQPTTRPHLEPATPTESLPHRANQTTTQTDPAADTTYPHANRVQHRCNIGFQCASRDPALLEPQPQRTLAQRGPLYLIYSPLTLR